MLYLICTAKGGISSVNLCIQADTLILAGRFDLIRQAETEHIAKVIPHARLMILPWETHTSYVVHSEKLGRILLKYLNDLREEKHWARISAEI